MEARSWVLRPQMSVATVLEAVQKVILQAGEREILLTVEPNNPKRTLKQNKTQRQWCNMIAEVLTEHDAEYWRGYSKLHFGIPILRRDDEHFRTAYDKVFKGLDYEKKIALMQEPFDFPVTRLMKRRQKAEYLDRMGQYFIEQGVVSLGENWKAA